MFKQSLIRYTGLKINLKFNSLPKTTFCTKIDKNASNVSDSKKNFATNSRIPTSFEKLLLVWVKKYPKGQIPDKVSHDTLHQTSTRARIKLANYMMAITFLGCLYTVYSGKKSAAQGDSVQRRVMERHKKAIEEDTTNMNNK